MGLTTTPIFMFLRSAGRAVGLNKLVARFILGKGYETKYENKFINELLSNDCIWDIGANIGHYTKIFSDKVSDSGAVCAFEPSPINFSNLEKNCRLLNNIFLFNFGLGEKKEKFCFQQGIDNLGATSRIVDSDVGEIEIDVFVGLDLIENNIAKAPTAIKIDVEGFEYEVIKGFGNYLGESKLHLIGIEIHFEILKDRGLENAPVLIEKILVENGFNIDWTDPSHIVAMRNT
jgi:FkbM family methyltransferase